VIVQSGGDKQGWCFSCCRFHSLTSDGATIRDNAT
jgi:hypothetical protein